MGFILGHGIPEGSPDEGTCGLKLCPTMSTNAIQLWHVSKDQMIFHSIYIFSFKEMLLTLL